MPEGPELRIMSDYINQNCSDRIFDKSFQVQKGNIPNQFELLKEFKIYAESFGKELILKLYNNSESKNISVFMGMSGNWRWTPTEVWNDTKYCRLRLDTIDGWSLLLYGSYMGPKFNLSGSFSGAKRGPDPIKEFIKFKENIFQNRHKKAFEKPIAEVIMNQEYFNGVGAYLNSEILGRLDFNPYTIFSELNDSQLNELFNMIVRCMEESYSYGGGQLMDWDNPFGGSRIDEWIKFYGNKEICFKEKFGTRNIWINKKFKGDN